MKYFDYILRSLKFEKTYVGMTNDLGRRLSEHNSGKSNYTSMFKPWEIIYTEELEVVKKLETKKGTLRLRLGENN